MDYNKYYEARDVLTEILRKDFLGPISEDEIICDEYPLDYYMTGKLYPQKSEADIVLESPSDDIADLDSDSDDSISLCNGKNPSSFGISFNIMKNVNEIKIEVTAANYNLLTRDEAQEKLHFNDTSYRVKASFWSRNKIEYITKPNIKIISLKLGKSQKLIVSEKLTLSIFLHKIYGDGSKTITVSLINENISGNDFNEECLNSFFQPEIKVTSDIIPAFEDIRRNVHLNKDPEVQELNMLYSKAKNFASGHGCAVKWIADNQGNIVEILTDYLPTFEVKQMMAVSSFKNRVLSMKWLSEATVDEVTEGLRELTLRYSQWIDLQRKNSKKLEIEHSEVAKVNLEKCKKTLERLNKSTIELNNPTVFKAFSLANKAMFLQRKKMLMNTDKYENDEKIVWFPFQLAFFLQEIISFSEPESEERKNVDLLWFPTGGGKTEAYLGIAAFAIFLRRLLYGIDGNGVTVLMRYTLRLLTFQQFERASALVCACELIRREEHIEGGEIGIGLWAGRSLTPNYIKDAKKILDREKDGNNSKYDKKEKFESGNPAQINKCPWCGANIPPEEPYYHCDEVAHRMYINCSNPNCEFRSGLPVYIIDEEIYFHMPTYIVATIDKFAQLALNDATASIFGIGQGKKPPDLIIQDELHLISGPLGTITGLYEAAFKKLSEHGGHYPKVIASTATIRNAKEQIKALYASNYTQFPPQGIDIEDSFFAKISDKTEKPARLYFGCMAIGTSPTTMMIRVMAALLYATRYLVELGYDEKVIDSFWTLTGYFNTLRELGGAIVRVVDDIQDRYKYLKNGKFKHAYPMLSDQNRFDRYKELTSREDSENIGNVIQKELKIPYKKDGSTYPYDFLLSSNMISVGVDVGRLGTMIVVGQPKASAEYIQATSRVGRETPGLVIATYNQAKSRDRSHYEQFTQYHETFYRYVEATSVTPFSDRARDRVLQTLYVILCRYLISNLQRNDDAVNFNKSMPGLSNIKKYILDYVKIVDPDETLAVKEELEDIEDAWENKAYRAKKLKYYSYYKPGEALFDPDYNEKSRFRVLNTMRSVETTIDVMTEE